MILYFYGWRMGRYRYQIIDIINTGVSLKNIDTCEKYRLSRSLSILLTWPLTWILTPVLVPKTTVLEVLQPCGIGGSFHLLILCRIISIFAFLYTRQQNAKPETNSEPPKKRGRRPGRKTTETPEKKKKPDDIRTDCCVCKQSGTNSNLVR